MDNKADTKKSSSSDALFPMACEEGPYNYAKNSNYQKTGWDLVKRLTSEEISKKLDVEHLISPGNVFRIADMGCSFGPNTFFAVQDIVEAVKSKQNQSKHMEFQVFFNDHSANDFNILFRTLPSERSYFAAGVPGSFYGSLFPKASLHFVLSSYTIHWMSKLPREVQDQSSPVWNKGRIFYGSSKKVEEAYAAQFANDFESFLKARAEEVVPGGFMTLLMPGTQNGANLLKCTLVAISELLGSSLMDMAKEGLVDEARVDSFNLPVYYPSSEKVIAIVEKEGWFKIEQIQEIARPMTRQLSKQDIEKYALFIRGWAEVVVRDHFGVEIVDEVFSNFTEKLMESGLLSDPSIAPMVDLFVLLMRTNN
ncbi:hypothetical protein SLA2020_088800 [Shorea laevis]